MSDNPNQLVELSVMRNFGARAQKYLPFIAGAIAEGELPVRNDANNPLASIEDVRRLGNTGGGDLGDLLVLFAVASCLHAGRFGRLDKRRRADCFLSSSGSQGSHPGHSGILQGDPETPGSGRLSHTDFERLTNRAQDGWIKRSDVGRFIAENLIKIQSLRSLI